MANKYETIIGWYGKPAGSKEPRNVEPGDIVSLSDKLAAQLGDSVVQVDTTPENTIIEEKTSKPKTKTSTTKGE